MTRVLRINTLGCRWDLTFGDAAADVVENLAALWSRSDTDVPDRSEPPGFPRPIRVVVGADPDRTPDPVAGDRMPAQDAWMPDAWMPDDSTPGVPVVRIPAGRGAAYALSSGITAESITAQAGRLTLLHAAALALPETGATALLIAPSGMGKTTAAARLGRSLGYLSDETAAVRDDLTVLAHPKPLSIVPGAIVPGAIAPGAIHAGGGNEGGGKEEESPDALGLLPPPERSFVGMTVLLDRDAEATAVDLAPMSLIEALVHTIPQTSSLPLQPHPLTTLARVLTAGAGVFSLRYKEIDEALEVLQTVLRGVDQDVQPVDEWAAYAPDPVEQRDVWRPAAPTTGVEVTAGTVIERVDWLEALEAEYGEVLVLVGPTPIRLLGIGATLWLTATEPTTVADLIEVCTRVHGDHPEAATLVVGAITTMLAAGVVRVARAVASADGQRHAGGG